MVRRKSKTKTLAKIMLFISVILVGVGIFKVNLELAEVVKPSSSFQAVLDKDPLVITLKVGEFNIKFNGSRFGNFFNGIETIVERVF